MGPSKRLVAILLALVMAVAALASFWFLSQWGDSGYEGWYYLGGGMYVRVDCASRAIIHSRRGKSTPLSMSSEQFRVLCLPERR